MMTKCLDMEKNTASNQDIARKIRQSFRLLMSGPTSQSMREKGMEYHINWGIALPHLQEMAREYEKDFHVALELWKDNVRESKLMALMLMPVESFTPDIATVWTESLQTQEIAEMAAMLLFQHLDYAPQLAFRYLADGSRLQQILALNILSRLFSRDMVPNERGLNELLDQISVLRNTDDTAVLHAIHNCLLKLSVADGGVYEQIISTFIEH